MDKIAVIHGVYKTKNDHWFDDHVIIKYFTDQMNIKYMSGEINDEKSYNNYCDYLKKEYGVVTNPYLNFSECFIEWIDNVPFTILFRSWRCSKFYYKNIEIRTDLKFFDTDNKIIECLNFDIPLLMKVPFEMRCDPEFIETFENVFEIADDGGWIPKITFAILDRMNKKYFTKLIMDDVDFGGPYYDYYDIQRHKLKNNSLYLLVAHKNLGLYIVEETVIFYIPEKIKELNRIYYLSNF